MATKIRFGAGQATKYMVQGIGVFSTTDATVEVSALGLSYIESVNLTWLGTPNANEPLSLNETVGGSGTDASPYMITVPSTGTVTVTRAAGTTSAGKFAYQIIGL